MHTARHVKQKIRGMLCDMMKESREEWISELCKKLANAARKVKVSAYEKNIVKEIIKDIGTYFNGEAKFWTNQQVLGIREVFRGVVVKIWVAMPLERVIFLVHNKIIVREAVNFYSQY